MRRRKRRSSNKQKKVKREDLKQEDHRGQMKTSNSVSGSVSIDASSALSLLLITPQLSQTNLCFTELL